MSFQIPVYGPSVSNPDLLQQTASAIKAFDREGLVPSHQTFYLRLRRQVSEQQRVALLLRIKHSVHSDKCLWHFVSYADPMWHDEAFLDNIKGVVTRHTNISSLCPLATYRMRVS